MQVTPNAFPFIYIYIYKRLSHSDKHSHCSNFLKFLSNDTNNQKSRMKALVVFAVVVALIALAEQVSSASTVVPDDNQLDQQAQVDKQQELEKWQQLFKAVADSFDLTKDVGVSFPETSAGKNLKKALDQLSELFSKKSAA